MGVNPLHIPFAVPTKNGNALTQYKGDVLKNCWEITKDFPNKVVFHNAAGTPFIPNQTYTALDNDGTGEAGQNPDGSVLTLIDDLVSKMTIDILNFLQYKLFWDIIYHKFLKILIIFHPKILAAILKPWVKKKIIGIFVAKLYCFVIKFIYFFENIPLILGIRPPPIGGDKKLVDKAFGKNETDLSFEYADGQKEEITTSTHNDSQPFKDEKINLTITQMKDCSTKEETIRTEETSRIEKEHTVEERKKSVTMKLKSCKLNVSSIFGDEPEDAQIDGGDDEGCVGGQIRLLVEDLTDLMGMGIDDKAPFQEGFIPPPCYDYAQKILEYVRTKDALLSNKGSKVDTNYNSMAVIFDPIVTRLRDYHESAKFMITTQDNSEGTKKLMENTAKISKYRQIYMNKDVLNFRSTLVGGNSGK
jgi:hypothetical protein